IELVFIKPIAGNSTIDSSKIPAQDIKCEIKP
ncbi:unnamed protein product, partial [marine sediment metagenome]